MKQATEPEYVTVLNFRFIAIVAGLIVAICVPAYFIHGYQVDRLASSFLERADECENEEQWPKAVSLIEQYLRVHPRDTVARIRLARVFGQAVEGRDRRQLERAVHLFDRALGLAEDAEKPALLKRQAELLLALRRFEAAVEQSQALLELEPNDPDALRIIGVSNYWRFQADDSRSAEETLQALEDALRVNAGHVTVSVLTAEFTRQHGREPEKAIGAADAIIEQMIQANRAGDQSQLADSLLAAYQYRRRHGLEGADRFLDEAIATDDAEANFNVQMVAASRAVEQMLAEGATAETEAVEQFYGQAVKHYENAIADQPFDRRGYLGLAKAHVMREQADDALKALDKGLRILGSKDWLLLMTKAEILIGEKRLEPAKAALVKLDESLAAATPGMRSTQAARLNRYRDALEAQWYLDQGRTTEAIKLLEGIADSLSTLVGADEDAAFHLSVLTELAKTFSTDGNVEQAATYYDQAAKMQPENVELQLATAHACVGASRLDAAVQHYREALRINTDPKAPWRPAALLALARMLFSQQLQLSQTKRDWLPVIQAWNQANQARADVPDAWQIDVLAAQIVMIPDARPGLPDEQRRLEAIKLLKAAEKNYPDSADLLSTLILAYQRLGEPESADRVLEKFVSVAEDPARKLLVRAQLLVMRKDLPGAKRILEDGLSEVPKDKQRDVALRLARLRFDSGEQKAALRDLELLSDKHPEDTQLVKAMLELLDNSPLRTTPDGTKKAERWEERLEKLEPESVELKYYRARRLLAEAQKPSDEQFREALRLQTSIQSQSPNGARGYSLQGQSARMLGKHEEAIEALESAIQLGDRRTVVFGQLIDSLYRRQRFEDAAVYLEQLKQRAPLSESLASLELSIEVGQQKTLSAEMRDWDKAKTLARERMLRSPKDPLAHIWLGQVYLLSDERDSAESAFRKAVDLAPTDPRTWNGLFSFLVLVQEKEKALETLNDMITKTELPEPLREFVLGQGYESLKDYQKAEEHYDKALKLTPNSVDIRMRLARLLAKVDPERAIPVLTPLARESAQARRMTAILLLTRRDDKSRQEALRLLRVQSGEGDEVANRRIEALILASSEKGSDRNKAQDILKEIVQDSASATATDRLQLATLYEREGKTALSRKIHTSLASQPNATPYDVSECVKYFFRQKDWRAADPWIRRLGKLEPGSYRVLGYRLIFLKNQGSSTEIAQAVRDFHASKDFNAMDREAQASHLSKIGVLLMSVEQYHLAVPVYRELTKLEPSNYRLLAMALARNGQTLEAVQVCVEPAKSQMTPESVLGIALVLMTGSPSDDANQLAEPILVEALQKFGDQAQFVNVLAAVRHIQQRFDDSRRLYEQVLKLDPKHILAMNNMAAMLGEQSEHREEALTWINKAFQLAPDDVGLRDTKAMILFHLGRPREAQTLLEEAVRLAEGDPRYRFHLALVQQELGEVEDARDQFQQAIDLNLELQILSPLEQDLLVKLKRDLSAERQEVGTTRN